MSLAEYLSLAAARPFTWGSWDCLLWLADWINDQRGVDPGAAYRGRYRTALGCARLVEPKGGVLSLFAGEMIAIGLPWAIEPQPGDVGIVEARVAGGAVRHVGAIKTSKGWAVLSPPGLSVGAFRAVAAWKV